MYKDLILFNYDKSKWLIQHKNKIITVESYRKKIGESVPHGDRFKIVQECRIEDVTPYFVRLKDINLDKFVTEELYFINITWDEEKNRPKIIVRFP